MLKLKHDQYCEKCGDLLNQKRIKWLEYSNKTGLYTDPKKVKVKEDDSQGLFPFGQACAKTVLKNGGTFENN
jgi:hypothetical protein